MSMYRRPRSLEVLDAIRIEMAREADFDADLFAEYVRSGYVREPSKAAAKPAAKAAKTPKQKRPAPVKATE